MTAEEKIYIAHSAGHLKTKLVGLDLEFFKGDWKHLNAPLP